METAPKERLVALVNRLGLCNQPGATADAWHPINVHITPTMAKKLCKGCPVVVACKELALRDEERLPSHGVYGALDPHARRALVKKRQETRATRAREAAEAAAEAEAGDVVNLDVAAHRTDTAVPTVADDHGEVAA